MRLRLIGLSIVFGLLTCTQRLCAKDPESALVLESEDNARKNSYALLKCPPGFTLNLKDYYPAIDGISPTIEHEVQYILNSMSKTEYPAKYPVRNAKTGEEILPVKGQDGNFYQTEGTTLASTFIVLKNKQGDLIPVRWLWIDEKSLTGSKSFAADSTYVSDETLLRTLLRKIQSASYPTVFPSSRNHVVLRLDPPLVTTIRKDFSDPRLAGLEQTIPYVFIPLKEGFGVGEKLDEIRVSRDAIYPRQQESEYLRKIREKREKKYGVPKVMVERKHVSRGEFKALDEGGPQFVLVMPKRSMLNKFLNAIGIAREQVLIDRRWLSTLDVHDKIRKTVFPEQEQLLAIFDKQFEARDKYGVPDDWTELLCTESPTQCRNARYLAAAVEKQRLLAGCMEGGKSQFQCEDEMRRSWLRCDSNEDCSAVPDDCGHWSPINKKNEADHMRTLANIGGMHCRWMAPTYQRTPKPTFQCIENMCKNHLIQGGIGDVKVIQGGSVNGVKVFRPPSSTYVFNVKKVETSYRIAPGRLRFSFLTSEDEVKSVSLLKVTYGDKKVGSVLAWRNKKTQKFWNDKLWIADPIVLEEESKGRGMRTLIYLAMARFIHEKHPGSVLVTGEIETLNQDAPDVWKELKKDEMPRPTSWGPAAEVYKSRNGKHIVWFHQIDEDKIELLSQDIFNRYLKNNPRFKNTRSVSSREIPNF